MEHGPGTVSGSAPPGPSNYLIRLDRALRSALAVGLAGS